jgi:putative ABC transport system permease protein
VGRHFTTVTRNIGPLGARVVKGDDHEIVGVVGDVKNNSLQVAAEPAIYFSQKQFPFRKLHIFVRGRGDATQLAALLRSEVQRIDPALPVADIKPMSRVLSESLDPPRFVMALLSAFAVLALVLAGVGIYGILTYRIGHRRREIGIRLALGGKPRDILRMIVREGFGLMVAGCVVGAAGAIVASRLLASFLYGVAPGDPATTAGVVTVVTVVALAACIVPGRMAAHVQPMEALRRD